MYVAGGDAALAAATCKTAMHAIPSTENKASILTVLEQTERYLLGLAKNNHCNLFFGC
jgi:hypothetical protein